MAVLVSQEDRRQQVLRYFVSSAIVPEGGVLNEHVDHRPARPTFRVGVFIATPILPASHEKAFCEEAMVKSIVSTSWSPDVSVIYPAPSPLHEAPAAINARIVIRHDLDRLRI